MQGHDERVLSTALSPDGETVASTSSDENLKFWKVFEKKGVKEGKLLLMFLDPEVELDDISSKIKRMTIR